MSLNFNSFNIGGSNGGGGGTANLWTSDVKVFYSNATLEPDTENNTYKDYEVDLSELLPDDGAQYEVLFLLSASSGNIVFSSDIVYALGGYAGISDQRVQLLAPVGAGRKVILRVHATSTNVYMNSSAYRKIG